MLDGTRFIHNTKKETSKMITIKIYKEPLVIQPHEPIYGKRRKRENFEPDESSIRRTQQKISDYVLCNQFELFCTFTLDPKKFPNRDNFSSCYNRMSRWLESQRVSHSPDLKYLVVPEKHKKGGYHFHALLSNFNGTLRDSGHKNNNRTVYNMTGWRVGFSTAVKIPADEVGVVSRYVRKYITKEMSKEFGRKRYLCSRNLEKPVVTHNSRSFRDCLPIGRKLLYERDNYSVYELDPAFFSRVKKQTEKYAKLIQRQRKIRLYTK